MIYLTGDTHGDFRRIIKYDLTDKDYIIVCGDFGIWYKGQNSTFDYLSKLPYKILFVDGNHSNFDWLNEFPIEDWNGGKVQFIRKNIIHLMRGYVFTIEGKTIFTFGGARSVDVQGGILDKNDPNFKNKKLFAENTGRPYRIDHESWWKEEMPNEEEMKRGIDNLNKVNNKVDYVITHATSDCILKQISDFFTDDLITNYFALIRNKITFDKWYFGHYHIDENITDKDICLYYRIIELGEKL
jgi:uncharacterized protein YjhX (UPF0386 family)